jgi:hypothetical protein
MLRQARNNLKIEIRRNAVPLTVLAYPTIDNGYGDQVPDYSQTPIETPIVARVSLDRRGPVKDETQSTGLTTNFSRFILTDWNTPLVKDAVVKGLERDYKLNSVTPLIKFGGIYGYQAVLHEGSE